MLSSLVTVSFTRLVLLLVGVYWVSVETVHRKRRCGNEVYRDKTFDTELRSRTSQKEAWNPQAGDVIISNWVSWLEIAWIAKFNPIFVLPVMDEFEKQVSTDSPSRSASGRRTGTGTAAVSSSIPRLQVKRAEVLGFVEVSLLRMITICGLVPPFNGVADPKLPKFSFEEVRIRARQTGRPVMLFPECTTSNGRGLLRFADVLEGFQLPVREFNIFLMCTRYEICISCAMPRLTEYNGRIDPPTALAPTLSLSIPHSSSLINIARHTFAIACSLSPHALSIRLISPSESPSSGSFLLSEFPSEKSTKNTLMAVCATLISDVGRLKKMGMGWEDKSLFLDFYTGKAKR